VLRGGLQCKQMFTGFSALESADADARGTLQVFVCVLIDEVESLTAARKSALNGRIAPLDPSTARAALFRSASGRPSAALSCVEKLPLGRKRASCACPQAMSPRTRSALSTLSSRRSISSRSGLVRLAGAARPSSWRSQTV